jgi:hypothetical protein
VTPQVTPQVTLQGTQIKMRLVQNCFLRHNWLTFLAAIGLTFLPACAQRSGPPAVRIERSGDSPTTKILFIGQSILFAYDTPHIFHAVAKSKRPEETFLIEMVAGGGYSLKDHYEEGTALREIRKERWNFIIIQESTANQIAYHQLFEQYAPFFDQEARKVGAQPLLFECYDDSLNEDCKMHLEVLKVAKMLREPVVPVGSAWRYVRKYYPKMHILGPDFHHPSPLGSYLMACVLYSKIYKEPSDGAMVNLELNSPNNAKVTNLCSTTTPEMKEIEQASWTVVRNLP